MVRRCGHFGIAVGTSLSGVGAAGNEGVAEAGIGADVVLGGAAVGGVGVGDATCSAVRVSDAFAGG